MRFFYIINTPFLIINLYNVMNLFLETNYFLNNKMYFCSSKNTVNENNKTYKK